MAPKPLRVLALIPELMTMVRVEAALSAAGWKLQTTETPADFLAAFYTTPPAVALVDLGAGEPDIDTIADHCGREGVPLVTFGRHNDTAILRAAKQAGATAVIPRGKFLEDPVAQIRDVLSRVQTRAQRISGL